MTKERSHHIRFFQSGLLMVHETWEYLHSTISKKQEILNTAVWQFSKWLDILLAYISEKNYVWTSGLPLFCKPLKWLIWISFIHYYYLSSTCCLHRFKLKQVEKLVGHRKQGRSDRHHMLSVTVSWESNRLCPIYNDQGFPKYCFEILSVAGVSKKKVSLACCRYKVIIVCQKLFHKNVEYASLRRLSNARLLQKKPTTVTGK